LIVGARSGAVQLLLYSVFRIGNATNNISWQSYQEIINQADVAWSIPLSLGDSHRGFRVLGTNQDYLRYYQYRQKTPLRIVDGQVFDGVFDAVIGAEVAKNLGYQVGDPMIVAHGSGTVSFIEHADKPFRVVGILAHTGTPVDRTVHVTLAGIEAIHQGWQQDDLLQFSESLKPSDLTPKAITAFLLGAKSRIRIFSLQRSINEYAEEPLLAVLPGIALSELWSLMAVAENALLLISAFVIFSGLSGMLAVILSSLAERRREMSILRSLGAKPLHIVGLLVAEAIAYALAGIVVGVVLLYLSLFAMSSILESHYGIAIQLAWLSVSDILILVVIVVAAALIGLIPAFKAYRQSLVDGLAMRL